MRNDKKVINIPVLFLMFFSLLSYEKAVNRFLLKHEINDVYTIYFWNGIRENDSMTIYELFYSIYVSNYLFLLERKGNL